jgi:hypothetical protein
MSTNTFGEFMELFPKGLNPFKIQTRFKLEFVMEIIVQNPERIEVGPKRKLVPLELIYNNSTFENLWTSGSSYFVFWKFGHLNSIGKKLRIKEKG